MATVPPIVQRWKAAWESGDPDAVAALYGPASTHDSAKVAAAMPELGGATRLTGSAQLRLYAERAFARVGRLSFALLSVVAGDGVVAVEYERTSSNEPTPKRVVEILEWRGDIILATRVYHP
jgi:hypothetical protein